MKALIGLVLCVGVSFAQAENCTTQVDGYLQAQASMAAQEPVASPLAATLASAEITRVQALRDRYADCAVLDQIPVLKTSKEADGRAAAMAAQAPHESE